MGWLARQIATRAALSGLWTLLVCYPDPRVLWQSIQHTLRPPIDAEAVRDWARTLPDDPSSIEKAVYDRVQYAVPWQMAGVPWTFASPAQALATGYGDCQARAVVFASVLAAKKIPFQLRASVDHMWVEFAGKQPNVLENAAKTLWTRPAPSSGGKTAKRPSDAPAAVSAGGAGGITFRLPRIDWAESWRIEREYFWDPAPLSRKLLLGAGIFLLWFWPAKLEEPH